MRIIPFYRGPETLGQLWDMSEDAQEVWAAYQELEACTEEMIDKHEHNTVHVDEAISLIDSAYEHMGQVLANSDQMGDSAREAQSGVVYDLLDEALAALRRFSR